MVVEVKKALEEHFFARIIFRVVGLMADIGMQMVKLVKGHILYCMTFSRGVSKPSRRMLQLHAVQLIANFSTVLPVKAAGTSTNQEHKTTAAITIPTPTQRLR